MCNRGCHPGMSARVLFALSLLWLLLSLTMRPAIQRIVSPSLRTPCFAQPIKQHVEHPGDHAAPERPGQGGGAAQPSVGDNLSAGGQARCLEGRL